ncbi:TOBE domain-containing protein [Flavobacterium sp. IB48]|uniref:TOBE domain-containing protein n=1 Tax=Flavobacterium sp. IB48 TaxID=2779375 RepID=UPI0018E8F4C1|nr:TOBE domain-containing protein [Flavobacterium sp. IB48]MBJ2125927.1 TOBE domain-containing protein [Flavobacterium sp. IB48]
MNVLKGIITKIQSHEGISLVKLKSNENIFTSIILDVPDYLKENNTVKIIFKETEVIISKDLNPSISVQNQLYGRIESIKKGVILSQITLSIGEDKIQSIITTNACEQLDLKENQNILALIKTNEVSLSAYD